MNTQFLDRLKSDYFRLLNIFNAFLVVLLIVSCLFLARDIISVKTKKKETAVYSPRAAAKAPKKTFQDYAPVVRNNPFGAPGGELKLLSAPSGGSQGSAVLSGLTLVGTISGSSKHSYAIFKDKSNKQELFRTGDSVYGTGMLDRVEKDRVFIKSSSGVTEVPIADFIEIVDSGRTPGSAGGSSFAKNIGEGTYVVDQRKVLQALEKPQQMMTDARLLPNNVDGRQQGFSLSEVKSGGIYHSLGLQNGDVLLRINEYNISNPEAALQAFTALRGMDRVQLDIIRNGAPMTMTYQIK